MPSTKSSLYFFLFYLTSFIHAHAQQADPNSQINRPSPGQVNVSPVAGNTTIQSGINAAGTTGSVTILPTYQGGDTWTNSSNVRVVDQRPFNPNNSTTYPASNPPNPGTTIKAADYGARCMGANTDDTAAIQAALNALASIQGGFYVAPNWMSPTAVELPQGRCQISKTLVMNDYGSLLGSPNGTWLSPNEPWHSATGDMIDVTTTYFPTSTTGNHQLGSSQIGRVISNINFVYNDARTQHTAIHVFDPTGKSSAAPYPAGANVARYQVPHVTISGNTFLELDEAIELEDCGECTVFNNYIFATRIGINDQGNNFGLVVDDNSIQNGTYRFSPAGYQKGGTFGLTSESFSAYACSNTNKNCSGGSVTAGGATTSPQGLIISNNDFSAWDTALFLQNIQGTQIHDNTFDYGASGAMGSATSTVKFGASAQLIMFHHNYVANAHNKGIGIEVQAPTSAAGGSASYNDIDIDHCYFTNYNDHAGSPAIEFDSGNFPRRGVKIEDNTFESWSFGVAAFHGLQYSVISGNYAYEVNAAGEEILLDSASAGPTDFSGTTIFGNTSSSGVRVLVDTAGGGFSLGFNASPAQLTGTQLASASGCTITAGAVGNSCLTTVNLATAYPAGDTAYSVQCSLVGASIGPDSTGDISGVTNTSFQVRSIAQSTAANGGGTVKCTVTHN